MDEPESRNRVVLFAAVCAVNLAAFTCGTAIGWTSPIISKLNRQNESANNPLPSPISNEQQSWLGCLLPLGAVFGPLVAGILVDKIGRKKTLLLSIIPFIVAFLTAIFAKNIILFFLVRVLSGLGLGAIFMVLPIFVAEIAEDEVRSTLGSFMQLPVAFGILYSYVIGPYVSIPIFNITCLFAPIMFLIVFFIYVPESPCSLILKDKKTVIKFRTKTSKQVQKELTNESVRSTGAIRDIFKSKSLIKALVISLSLVSIQQLSGVYVILFYTQTIFEAAGSAMPPDLSTIIVGELQVLSSFIAPIVVDKIGKRFLLLVSAVGMGISEAVLGYYFYLHENKINVESIFWLPVLCLVLYNVFFCVGFGPLTWNFIGELFPSNIKSVVTTLTFSCSWFLAFTITKFFSNLSGVIGMRYSFWILTIVCSLGTIFVYFYVPETTGRSLQEIQSILNA